MKSLAYIIVACLLGSVFGVMISFSSQDDTSQKRVRIVEPIGQAKTPGSFQSIPQVEKPSVAEFPSNKQETEATDETIVAVTTPAPNMPDPLRVNETILDASGEHKSSNPEKNEFNKREIRGKDGIVSINDIYVSVPKLLRSPIAIGNKPYNPFKTSTGSSYRGHDDGRRIIIILKIKNDSQRRVLFCQYEYLYQFTNNSSHNFMRSCFSLEDDAGNDISGTEDKMFRDDGFVFAGQFKNQFPLDLPPGYSFTDLHYFNMPLPGTKYLVLKIARELLEFRGETCFEEELVFKVPVSSIRGYASR